MKAFQKNPVFWLMWAIPGAAVLAGTSMVAVALKDADRPLPNFYHWEGELLDADFERAKFAARLGLKADLAVEGGRCLLTLAPAPPSKGALKLRLTNGSDVRLDRLLTLAQVRPGQYHGDCEPLQRGRWRVAVQDTDDTWSLNGQLNDAQTRVSLRARDPEGQGT